MRPLGQFAPGNAAQPSKNFLKTQPKPIPIKDLRMLLKFDFHF